MVTNEDDLINDVIRFIDKDVENVGNIMFAQFPSELSSHEHYSVKTQLLKYISLAKYILPSCQNELSS